MTLEEIRKKAKEVRRDFILINLSAVVLGIILAVFPGQSKDIICRGIGILLSVWGGLKIIDYIRLRKNEIFGSFSLVKGCALLGFGIYIILRPYMLAAFITAALSIILFISGVLKLQYALDFAHLRSRGWTLQAAGAVIMIAAAVISFVNPFGASDILMVFIGICIAAGSIWDLATMLYINNFMKEIKGEAKPRKRKNSSGKEYIDVDIDE